MKFEIDRDVLLPALQSVIGAVERRQTLPILNHVLFDAADTTLMVVATDLEIELCSRAEAKVEQDGQITLPARKLYDICRSLPVGAVMHFSKDKEQMLIKAERSRYKLSTLPADDFPRQDAMTEGSKLTLEAAKIGRVIRKTAFAMAVNDVRAYLNGMLLELHDDFLRAVTTDAHRLALCDQVCDINIDGQAATNDGKVQFIVPRKGVAEMQRLLEGGGEAELRFDSRSLQMVIGNSRLTTKLMEGRYPDYERVIPTAFNTTVKGNRAEFRAACSRSAVLANEKFKGVRLILEGNEMALDSHNAEHEESEDAIAIEYGGEKQTIGFNLVYVADALAAMDTDEFELSMIDADKSGLLTEPGNGNLKYIVMPMRL